MLCRAIGRRRSKPVATNTRPNRSTFRGCWKRSKRCWPHASGPVLNEPLKVFSKELFVAQTAQQIDFVTGTPGCGAEAADAGELCATCRRRARHVGASGDKKKKIRIGCCSSARIETDHRHGLGLPTQQRAAGAGRSFKGLGQRVI